MDKREGNGIPQSLQQHLHQLGEQFAERLRQELPQLAQQAQQLPEASDEQRRQLLRALRDQLHRLAGSAGTFGFDTLGQQARELEQQAELWLERQLRQQQDLDAFIAALQQLGSQSAGTTSQGEPYRVLIVDDDLDLASRYSLVLRGAGMLVEVLRDPAQIFEHLRDFNPEVMLLDVNMPDCTGPELAQIIRCNDDWLRIPIIYLSAETDIAKQMSALIKAGDDFVTKPISDNALVAAVFSRAQRARLLSDALSRDSLTGLLKHGDIKEQVAIELERALRSGARASVVMLDIDHFKRVNDEHGHAAGDNVIRALANLLRQRLRRVDSLGRYGGEEFLAVLPDCTPQQARMILDEIRERFAELRFIADGGEFSCSLSAGIAGTDVHSNAEQLRERADKALYAAKHGGRNQVQIADD
ncbi:diguanylate cyclase domain-containing protein [Ectopseudomonas hydrolytica]|uniref:diguanylate cyclase domain-containing protein n=1 Tax=Ectopseudomonas hydrolytica TaxID=2493633 RepID=UPI003EE19A86